MKQKAYMAFDPVCGLVKIGKSTRPDLRLEWLTDHYMTPIVLLAVFDYEPGRNIEHELHVRYQEHRVCHPYGDRYYDNVLGLMSKSIETDVWISSLDGETEWFDALPVLADLSRRHPSFASNERGAWQMFVDVQSALTQKVTR